MKEAVSADHKSLVLFFFIIVLVQTTLITVQILRAPATYNFVMLRNVACVFVHCSLFILLSKSTCEEEIVFHRAARLLFGSNSIAPQQM